MSRFHEGERAIQQQAGVREMAERVGQSIGDTMPPVARDWLQVQHLAAIAALATEGNLWATLLAGPSGFLEAPDERTLLAQIRLAADEPLRGALEGEVEAGLIVLEPARRRRMRFNGVAHLEGERLRVQAREVYSNCPKYIQARTIAEIEGDELQTDKSWATVVPHLHAQGHALEAEQRGWIEGADTFFIGSSHPSSGADCSHRGGLPGFVRVEGEVLSWLEYPGNAMFNTLGNLAVDNRAALVFADWGSGDSLQLSGKAQLLIGADGHRVKFQTHAWRHVKGTIPSAWDFGSFSPFLVGTKRV